METKLVFWMHGVVSLVACQGALAYSNWLTDTLGRLRAEKDLGFVELGGEVLLAFFSESMVNTAGVYVVDSLGLWCSLVLLFVNVEMLRYSRFMVKRWHVIWMAFGPLLAQFVIGVSVYLPITFAILLELIEKRNGNESRSKTPTLQYVPLMSLFLFMGVSGFTFWAVCFLSKQAMSWEWEKNIVKPEFSLYGLLLVLIVPLVPNMFYYFDWFRAIPRVPIVNSDVSRASIVIIFALLLTGLCAGLVQHIELEFMAMAYPSLNPSIQQVNFWYTRNVLANLFYHSKELVNDVTATGPGAFLFVELCSVQITTSMFILFDASAIPTLRLFRAVCVFLNLTTLLGPVTGFVLYAIVRELYLMKSNWQVEEKLHAKMS